MTDKKVCVKGFTLIELIIVIAVVSILVALAVPAYQEYTIRARVTECVSAAAVPKIQVSEYRLSMGRWPSNAMEAGIDQSFSALQVGLSKYCRIFFYNFSQGDFAIWVNSEELDSALDGVQIIPVMSPVESNSGIDWFCTRGFTQDDALRYLPSSCRVDNIY